MKLIENEWEMKIKKRKVIAILLTFICLILTNKFWLKFRSVPIDFDIWGNGNYNVEVQFNKKNNDEFKKIKNRILEKMAYFSFNLV